jgi:Autotransporter beta-domain
MQPIPKAEVWMNGATFGVYATFDARNGFYASTIISGSYSNYSTRRSIEFGTIDRTARVISMAAASEPSSR